MKFHFPGSMERFSSEHLHAFRVSQQRATKRKKLIKRITPLQIGTDPRHGGRVVTMFYSYLLKILLKKVTFGLQKTSH